MKTTIATINTANIVIGKNAEVVLRVADFDGKEEFAITNAGVVALVAGKSVGIVARNPVNKKEHVAEANEIVAHIKYSFENKTNRGDVVKMVETKVVRSLEVVQAEIADTREALAVLDRDYLGGKVKHDVKVATFNKLDKQLATLLSEEFEVRSAAIKTEVVVAELSNREQWAERQSVGLDVHRPSDVDHSKEARNKAFELIGLGIDYFKDQVLLSLESFDVVVHDIQAWAKDKYDRVGAITVQIPAKMMQAKQWSEELKKFVWYPMECFTYNALAPKNQRYTPSPACLVFNQYYAEAIRLMNLGLVSIADLLTFEEYLHNLKQEIAAAERFMANAIRRADKLQYESEDAKLLALGNIHAIVPMYSVLWFYLGGSTGTFVEAVTIAPADIARIKTETAHFGTAVMTFDIKESVNEGGAYVRLPKTRSEKDGNVTYYDDMMTRNIKFDFFNADNNHSMKAALSAYIRVFWSEFVQAEPANRTGFNEHCGTCARKVNLPVHDQMGVDFENSANPIDTSELGQWGSRMPQWICPVNKELMDKQAILDLNEADSFEGLTYTDENGEVRYPRPGYVVIKNKPVALFTIRANGTAEACARCPFYSKNDMKPEKRYAKEVEQAVATHVANGGTIIRKEKDNTLDMKAMGLFVPRYWTDRAQTNRQVVLTQHTEGNTSKWSVGFPGEFENPTAFMVQGLGGINVYGTERVNSFMNTKFVATTETYRAEEVQLAKLIDIVYNVCFSFDRLGGTPVDNSEEARLAVEKRASDTLTSLMAMIASTPKPAERTPLYKRYHDAMQYLVKTITDNK